MNFSEGGSRTGVGKGQAAEGGEEDSSLLLPVPIGPAYVNTPYGGWGQLRVTGGRHRGRRLLMPRTPVSGAVRPMMSKGKEEQNHGEGAV
ncbi:methyltransferase [Cystoisospora suis]|uniref:Methyltransferase n=1 Tax=Cystoisospora suis TaxID=483139 RepID=A0A2C6KXM3_9APIC|nr:methyltransferase [Cystoisospora suis]